MMGRLTGYFDDKLREQGELATSAPQSLRDIGSGSDTTAAAAVLSAYDANRVSYKVDYSDPSNFVFFNSALDYFNISGELIINDYPYDGTDEDVRRFLSGADDYQRWLLDNSWPLVLGNTSTGSVYYDFEGDFNPGTSSFSIEAWINPDTSAHKYLWRAFSGSYSVGVRVNTGSVIFSVASGTTTNAVTASFSSSNSGYKRYISCVYDRGASSMRIIHGPDVDIFNKTQRSLTGFIATYPTGTAILATSSISIPTSSFIDTHTTSSLTNFITVGDIVCTNVSFWSKARSLDEISKSYTGRIYKQENLEGLWRFVGSRLSKGYYWYEDYSGNKRDLRTTTQPSSYVPLSGSGDGNQLHAPYDTYEPIRSFGQSGPYANVLEDYVARVQTTATAYDRDNLNIITRLVPSAYLELEENIGTNNLHRFLYVMARQFDQIKVAIDQFVYVNKINWTAYNQSPDALLQQMGKFYGWDFVGNFLDHDAIKYFFGKNVVPGTEMETKLFQIKNAFWKRTLNELMHIYKTKGTRASVESLIRTYGLDDKLIKLKEYGTKPVAAISTQRINSHKSVPALRIRSNTTDSITHGASIATVRDGYTVEMHARLSSPTSALAATLYSNTTSVGPGMRVLFSGTTPGNTTGTLVMSMSFAMSMSVPIFDGKWYSMFFAVPSSGTTGSFAMHVKLLEGDEITREYSVSSSQYLTGTIGAQLIGKAGNTGDEYYLSEYKFYNNHIMTDNEMRAHTYDFQSYGLQNFSDTTASLVSHLRLDDDFSLGAGQSTSGIIYDSVVGNPGKTLNLSGLPLATGTYSPFQRFLRDYNFIAPPEYGWNEDKIRVVDGYEVPDSTFNDSNAIALEFNLVDALNEDISKMLATIDNWNNVIGLPANKYRDNYPELQSMRNYYFDRLYERINFRTFADLLEFFDRSFVKMVQQLLPARAVFYGEEFVVESHMLERPKVQWTYRRRNPDFLPMAILTMTERAFSGSSEPVSKIFA